MRKIPKTIALAFFLMVALLAFFAYSYRALMSFSKTAYISYNHFVEQVEKGNIRSVAYNKELHEIYGVTTNGERFKTENPQTDDFKKYLLEHGIKVTKANPSVLSVIGKLLMQLLTSVLTIYLLIRIVIKKQEGIGSKRFYVVEKSDVTFDDVAGNEEAKEDMMELIEFLRNPTKYQRYGAKIPKGTILYGPPGTGKTLLAKALAGTAKVPFIAVSGSDFVEKFVGVGAARVRQLFQLAREKAPCIVFIDEIDALGKKRGGDIDGAHDEWCQTLNQLLVEMDGFTGNEGVIIIAATNRFDVLDEALLRAGRFDRQIQLNLPDLETRYKILKLHSKNKPLHPEVDLMQVAKMTVFMSGADLENVMNEAAIYAARHGHKGILMSDIDKAINKVIAGEERKSKKNISRKDKEVAAFHEAGHALVAKLLTNKSISKVTIIPTTKGAGGYTMMTPQTERLFETKKDLLNEIAVYLGGRVAEEIVFGEDDITGGASEDLKAVTRIAAKMVKDYGMSQLGLVNIGELCNNGFANNVSENIAQEVKKIVDETYGRVKGLLNEHKDTLFSLAQALMEKETLYEKEIDAIINGSGDKLSQEKAI